MQKKLNLNLLILISLLLTNFCFSQEADSLIELYPGFGKKIGFVDKEYYGLFNEFKGFDKAELFIRENKYLVSNISFFTDKIHDTTLVRPLSVLDSMRSQIKQVQEAYDKKLNSPFDAKVSLVTGEHYEGKLEMFSKKYFYLYSDKGIASGSTTHLRIKIPVSDIEAVVITGDSYTLMGLGFGSLAGGIIGAMIGMSTQEDQQCCFGTLPKEVSVMGVAALGAGIGALVGLVVGLAMSSSDEVIEIATMRDLVKLKEYAKYNPGDIVQPEVKYYQVESL